MKILALDSSGLVASVALVEDDNLIRRMVDLDMDTVDAIAVAAGPGSFTGLRIGSATAKGLAFAMEKPIIPVPTLEGLAWQMYGTDALVCPIMDARRNQVYTGLYEFVDRFGKQLVLPEDAKAPQTGTDTAENGYDMRVVEEQCAVAFDEIAQKINRTGRKVVFVGDGIPVFRERMAEVIQVPWLLAPAHRNRQSAACIAALGRVYYAQGRAVNGAQHVPEYLRLSQAERERAEGSSRT